MRPRLAFARRRFYGRDMPLPSPDTLDPAQLASIMRWYLDMGVDCIVGDAPRDRFADCAAELVGAANIDRNAGMTMASEDFSFMLQRRPGAYIQIGNGDGAGGCEVHNPGYDFNDEALPLGASLFARIVERKLARI